MTDYDLGTASCSRARGTTTASLLEDLTGVVPYVPNGNFETGDATGWTLTGDGTHTEIVDTTSKRSGTYGLHVTIGNSSSSQQSVTIGPVKAGQTVGGYVRVIQGGAAIYLIMIYDEATWIDYVVIDVSTPTGDFVEYSYEAPVDFISMSLTLFLQT